MIGHDQEAAVEHALLTGEHARHRRLHIIVDTAPRHAAEESERPSMSVEQHLLALTRIGPDVRRARCAETSVRHLDRKSVVEGKSVSVRVDLGGRRIIKKKKNARSMKHNNYINIQNT